MRFKNSLPVLVAVFSLSLTIATLNAQTDSRPGDTAFSEESSHGKLDRSSQFGPRYKNPRAAGRLKVINQIASGVDVLQQRVLLFGPAYKNRNPVAPHTEPTTNPAPKQNRLTGPRYKNRSAKAH